MKKRIALFALLLCLCALLVACGDGDPLGLLDMVLGKDVLVYVPVTDEWIPATYDESSRAISLDISGTKWENVYTYYDFVGLTLSKDDKEHFLYDADLKLAENAIFNEKNNRLYAVLKGTDITVVFKEETRRLGDDSIRDMTCMPKTYWAYDTTRTRLPVPAADYQHDFIDRGYRFSGWRFGDVLITDASGNLSASYRHLSEASFEGFTGGLVLTAQYDEPCYRVTYVYDNGSTEHAVYPANRKLVFERAGEHGFGIYDAVTDKYDLELTADSYYPVKFSAINPDMRVYGFSTEQGGTPLQELVLTEDVTLYAVYRRCKTAAFFRPGETEPYSELHCFEGESIRQSPFYDKYSQSSQTVSYDDPDTILDFPVAYGNLKPVYYKYDEDRITATGLCTITYVVPEGVTPPPAVTLKYSSDLALPTLTVSGYTFAGWYLNSDYSGEGYDRIERCRERYNSFYLYNAAGNRRYWDTASLTLYARLIPIGGGEG